jgi:hypothetical protein
VYLSAAIATSFRRRIAAFIAVSDGSITNSDEFGFCMEVSQVSGRKQAVLWH